MGINLVMTVVAIITGWSWTLRWERTEESCTVCAGTTRWEYYMCCHDSCCYDHRVELNTEALCAVMTSWEYLYMLPWQLLLWSQGEAEHWGALCCHDKLGIPIYVSCCYDHRVELNTEAREKDGELYCLRCHDKMGIPICGACRRPIDERVVHALGKTWHVEVSWPVCLSACRSVCSTLVSVCLCVCVCVFVTLCNLPWCGLSGFAYSLQFWGSLGTWASFSGTGKFWRKLSFLASFWKF